MLMRNFARLATTVALLNNSSHALKLRGLKKESEYTKENDKTLNHDDKEKEEQEQELEREGYDDEEDFFCPAERYIEWSQLPLQVTKDYMMASSIALQYQKNGWNDFESPVENMSWEELDADMVEGGIIMGYNEERWDCCLNHYNGYDFDDLDIDGSPQLQVAAKILGWNKDTWSSQSSKNWPVTEEKDWIDLIALEQAAADYLCYDENTWDQVPLPWDSKEPESPPAEMDFMCPLIRYDAWSELPMEEMYAALDLGYDSNTWNTYQNPIEQLSYEEITERHDWKEALSDLGYDRDTWDCCINNYMSYTYNDLDKKDKNYPLLQLAANTLGWTKSNWGSDDPDEWPESEFKYWDDLSDFEKAAADYLCFYKESWDAVSTIPDGMQEAYEEELVQKEIEKQLDLKDEDPK